MVRGQTFHSPNGNLSRAPRLTTMPAFCDRAEKILSDLIDELIKLDEASPEAEKDQAVQDGRGGTDVLNEDRVIETTAREELCELF